MKPTRLLILFAFAAALPLAAEELRTAAQVRSLGVEQAARHDSVRLRGVVTFFDERLFSRFLQDETAGIYLKESTNLPDLHPGMVVEVEGTTSPGEYAPVIETRHVRIVGEDKLPPALPATLDQLASGKEDSQFVEVAGIVRSVHFDETTQYYAIELAAGGGRLTVYTAHLPAADTNDLVDSMVRVRGVCSTQFNRQRQLFAIRLMVPRPEDFVVETPAAGDPFTAPTRSIGSLLQFTPQGTYGHRVKVSGTVTFQQPGNVLYLQDESYGLQVQTKQTNALTLGDRIEVLGFPAQGEYTPILQDAVYRKIGGGPVPVPEDITLAEALKGNFDCRLVRMRAKLVDRAQHSREEFLVLDAGEFIFHAYQGQTDGADAFPELENGSLVAVTGICLVEPGDWQAGESWRAKSFHLLLRSPADVVMLHAPPWWTLRRLLWTVGVLGVAVMAASAWVAVLRHRVQRQTEIIRQQLKAEAALKERYEELFENANDMVFTHDLTGRLTSINRAGERLLQRPRGALLSRPLLDLVAEDQRISARQWLEQVLKGAELPAAEWDFLNAGGQRVKLEVGSRLIDRDGAPVEVEGIARDITERRRLEREILEISNREQRRIGHDLHDGVCQQLAGIAYRLSILEDRLHEKSPAESSEAEQIGNLINEANSQARSVARGLFPVRLQESGLAAALEELADGISSRFPVECEFLCKEVPAVDNEAALHLYFIAQEAALNAVKHGRASRVTVSLAPQGDQFELAVRDNGRGFQMNSPSRTGMGIRIMRYRARVIGATLDLKSDPGTGTTLSCEFHPKSQDGARNADHDRNS
ncbi:MAG: PAS domain-containing sensor histidine kinase [Verrucomicrobiota bacterium]